MLRLELLPDHHLIRIDKLLLALNDFVYDEHRLDDYHSIENKD
jgi:hypothetical protein